MSSYARGDFSQSHKRSPVSLGAAIAINGAVVGALLLANPTFVKEKIKVIEAINIPLVTPPPDPIDPPKPVEQKVAQQAQRETPTVSDIPIAPTGSDFKFPLVDPPLNPGTGDLGVTRTIDPPHTPVFVGSQIHPRYRDALQPPYPPGMIRAEKEGVVVVRVLVGADGRVKEVQKIEAADDAFFRATVDQAMKRWRFVPATSDGQPVESWRTMTLRFNLENA